MFASRKGGAVLHIGAPIIIVTLIAIYIFLTYTSPSDAIRINEGLRNLSTAVRGVP